MSLKAIEMQIALPRTQDAGKIQEQLQQRGQTMGDFATQNNQKENEQKRKTVNKQEQKQNVQLAQRERENNGNNGSQGEEENKNSEEVRKEIHPYKGKIIDYSG